MQVQMVDSQETAKKKYITNGWNVAHQKSHALWRAPDNGILPSRH